MKIRTISRYCCYPRLSRHSVALVASGIGVAALIASSQAQDTGRWDLTEWNGVIEYTSEPDGSQGFHPTTQIHSSGGVAVALNFSANIVNGEQYFPSFEANSITTSYSPGEESWIEDLGFTLDQSVDFGPSSGQTLAAENGWLSYGLSGISGEDLSFTSSTITFTLEGGGIFTAFGGSGLGNYEISGVGTNVVTAVWNSSLGFDSASILFDDIKLSGPISGYSVLSAHESLTENEVYSSQVAVQLGEGATVVPEPSSALLAGLAGSFCLLRRRRSSVAS